MSQMSNRNSSFTPIIGELQHSKGFNYAISNKIYEYISSERLEEKMKSGYKEYLTTWSSDSYPAISIYIGMMNDKDKTGNNTDKLFFKVCTNVGDISPYLDSFEEAFYFYRTAIEYVIGIK